MKTKLRELVLQLQASPQKAGIFLVLCVVLAIVGGRQLIGAGPSRAAAQESVAQTRDQVLGLSDIAALETGGAAIAVPAPASGLRDLFRFDDRYFPPAAQQDPETGNSAKFDARPDDPSPVSGSSGDGIAEVIRAETERFRLRSTLLGARPIAVIAITDDPGEPRSEMLRIGEAVSGFELLEIQPRSVTLEKSGVRVTLTISGD